MKSEEDQNKLKQFLQDHLWIEHTAENVADLFKAASSIEDKSASKMITKQRINKYKYVEFDKY